nr:TPA_asm: M121 iORF [Murid betaherpesvirus 1]DBA08091.1 TPA_asm: M121 iORF [Murid betaherpesvirus 1]
MRTVLCSVRPGLTL